jgi:hypothetical protein
MPRLTIPCVLALSAGAALASAGQAAAQVQERLNRDRSGHDEIRGELPIKTVRHTAGAAEATLKDGEMVIGVVVDGRARAYPVNLMWSPENEVVNDTLGDTAVATAWCPVALAGEVYVRDLGDRRLDLGALGARDGVLVLYDRQTRSQWSTVAGRAIDGPLSGSRLRKLPSLVTTWGRWRALHPETTVYVADEPPAHRPRFDEESVGQVALGDAGPPRNEDWVVGLEGKTGAGAFLVRRLVDARATNETFDGRPVVAFLTRDLTTARVWERAAGGRVLTFAAKGDQLQDAETGSLWDPLTGKAVAGPLAGQALALVPSSSALWYAWKAQYPDAKVFAPAAARP